MVQKIFSNFIIVFCFIAIPVVVGGLVIGTFVPISGSSVSQVNGFEWYTVDRVTISFWDVFNKVDVQLSGLKFEIPKLQLISALALSSTFLTGVLGFLIGIANSFIPIINILITVANSIIQVLRFTIVLVTASTEYVGLLLNLV